MLYLQFQIDDNYYIIHSMNIIEVIPLVPLASKHKSSTIFAGELNYHGELIPVIDIKKNLTGEASQKLLSTRIIVLKTHHIDKLIKLGIIAEKATETINFDETDFRKPIIKEFGFFGDIALRKGLSYQKIAVDKLLWGSSLPDFDGDSSA